jgi:hypothetical protein
LVAPSLVVLCPQLPPSHFAMNDRDDGWQTIMPTSRSGMERLSKHQLESFELQVLRKWEGSRGHWSGV